ncbi:MAG: nucleotide sugar dehydrogenase [Verrucomicrobia bacterium]|nr:nucleotide sugar dehydrogenase [Verrucomicrobiota bacterium]
MSKDILKIAVVGGGGHVGLPLSLMLVESGFEVVIIDTDAAKIEKLKQGHFPFLEDGGPELLKKLKDNPRLKYSTTPGPISECHAIILTVGTPVDEHLNPRLSSVYAVIDQVRPFLRNGQVMILRSTLFPGTSEKIHQRLVSWGLEVGVSFCPERIAQGKALEEFRKLPQIISGSDARALETARRIFSSFAVEVTELNMTEAELAKLFTNTWRYLKFAVANQFYMVAESKGLDFYKIREAMTRLYPRAQDFPGAGFAAGPCLFKDAMQLEAFHRQNFTLGHAAMLINETLPEFLVEQAKREHRLNGLRVGILGMAFKADNDDNRESLAYKLRKLLVYENATVLCTDPFIQEAGFLPMEQVLESAQLLFIGCPHSAYRSIDWRGRTVVDCWGLTRQKK